MVGRHDGRILALARIVLVLSLLGDLGGHGTALGLPPVGRPVGDRQRLEALPTAHQDGQHGEEAKGFAHGSTSHP